MSYSLHLAKFFVSVLPDYKLQALVYDILPLEEGAGKRCSECGCRFQAVADGVFKKFVPVGILRAL